MTFMSILNLILGSSHTNIALLCNKSFFPLGMLRNLYHLPSLGIETISKKKPYICVCDVVVVVVACSVVVVVVVVVIAVLVVVGPTHL